jgi:hypothetical protein
MPSDTDSLDYDGGLLLADEKIDEGLDWETEMVVPVAGEEVPFGISLLNERTVERVKQTLPIDEFQAYRNEDRSEDYERFMELQRKGPDELDEEEREEFLELAEEVNPEEEGRDSLGDEAIDALMDAGKEALEPTEDDISDFMSLSPERQADICGGDLPDHLDTEVAAEQLRSYMQERIENQPFPIKFMLGQRAYLETVTVQGNGFEEDD